MKQTGNGKVVMKLNAKQIVLLLGISAFLGVFALSSEAQGDPVFSANETEACFRDIDALAAGPSGYSVLECVGRGAQACMMTPGGDTTFGMMACLEGELLYWDARLEAAYAERLDSAREQDLEMATFRSSAPPIENTLRALHQVWKLFRETSCRYEQALWMGGTGGGPAAMACHMHETARQALKYEGWWAQ